VDKSNPRIPQFGGEEPALVFSIWLRDELKVRPPETRRILARITGVTDETVSNWTKGLTCTSPGFVKAITVLSALNGWRDFMACLEGPERIGGKIRSAAATLSTTAAVLAEHPSTEELSEALDEVLALQRTAVELAQAIRKAQIERMRRRPVEVA
jgi:hypothetical protein